MKVRDEKGRFLKGHSIREIQDEYTDKPLSRQQKYALRHPERIREYKRRYRKGNQSNE